MIPLDRRVFIAVLLAASAAIHGAGATCESLASLKLPDTTITLAQEAPAGEFALPSGPPLKNLPVFCRVAGTIKPSGDSDIKFEVWMPVSNWNHKFQGVGNGGFAGSLSLPSMAGPLRRGYALATTDTGHTGNDATWASEDGIRDHSR